MELVAFGDINRFGNDDMILSWEMTEVCNFKCWYCNYPKLVKQGKPTEEQVYGIIDFFDKLSKVRNITRIRLACAEITTLPNVDVYIKKLADVINEKTVIELSSNMSAPISLYKNIIDYVLSINKKIMIFPSYHREFIDVYKFFDKVQEIHNTYKSNNNYSMQTTSFMIHSDICLQLAEKIYDDPKYKDIVFSIDSVREVEMPLEQLHSKSLFVTRRGRLVSIYKDNDVYKYKFTPIKRVPPPNFRKYICKCWTNNIVVRYDGDIDPCVFMYDNTQKESNVNIFKQDVIELLNNRKQLICTSSICPCDYAVPKFKMLEYSKLKNWTKQDILKLEKL